MDPRTKSAIPAGLDAEQRKVWETLLQVKAQRGTSSKATPRVVLITDLAEDYDDLLNLIGLLLLDKLGLIE